MSFEAALRATEILLAFAFLQSSLEHLFGYARERLLILPRFILAAALLLGIGQNWVLLLLSAHSVAYLHRFAGPYNGGSDRMGLLVLYCLTMAYWVPSWAAELALGYLGIQVALSYVISGQVKLANPD